MDPQRRMPSEGLISPVPLRRSLRLMNQQSSIDKHQAPTGATKRVGRNTAEQERQNVRIKINERSLY